MSSSPQIVRRIYHAIINTSGHEPKHKGIRYDNKHYAHAHAAPTLRHPILALAVSPEHRAREPSFCPALVDVDD